MSRRSGFFVTVDGPGGVGKSTVTALVGALLANLGAAVHITTQPSRTELGDHIRHGTRTYRGMALACLVAGDRHQQVHAEILPALHRGAVVLCDRYIPSSLVLQRLDGVAFHTIWKLNAGLPIPDLSVILTGNPDVIACRLHERGGHSRFEEQPGASHDEVRLYRRAVAELTDAGWPLLHLDATTNAPNIIARTIASQITTLFLERSPECPTSA
jgi:dTMP kinase